MLNRCKPHDNELEYSIRSLPLAVLYLDRPLRPNTDSSLGKLNSSKPETRNFCSRLNCTSTTAQSVTGPPSFGRAWLLLRRRSLQEIFHFFFVKQTPLAWLHFALNQGADPHASQLNN